MKASALFQSKPVDRPLLAPKGKSEVRASGTLSRCRPAVLCALVLGLLAVRLRIKDCQYNDIDAILNLQHLKQLCSQEGRRLLHSAWHCSSWGGQQAWKAP